MRLAWCHKEKFDNLFHLILLVLLVNVLLLFSGNRFFIRLVHLHKMKAGLQTKLCLKIFYKYIVAKKLILGPKVLKVCM